MLRARPGRGRAGLSLIELMITVALSAIVLAMAAPAMGNWVRDVEIRSSAASLLAALQGARAEAIARNTLVRLQLTDALGRPGWEVRCVRVSPTCPPALRRLPVNAGSEVRWGAATPGNMPTLVDAIDAGSGLPAGVTFDALGAAPAVAGGTDIARIDVTHARDGSARRLVVVIAARGMVRACDPLAVGSAPERCQ